MRESAEQKGRRYLTEGRLRVHAITDRGTVIASCRGGGQTYFCGWDAAKREWRCACEARTRCAHLVALQLVIDQPGSPTL
jgi:uncharacterized Zn finger protein